MPGSGSGGRVGARTWARRVPGAVRGAGLDGRWGLVPEAETLEGNEQGERFGEASEGHLTYDSSRRLWSMAGGGTLEARSGFLERPRGGVMDAGVARGEDSTVHC